MEHERISVEKIYLSLYLGYSAEGSGPYTPTTPSSAYNPQDYSPYQPSPSPYQSTPSPQSYVPTPSPAGGSSYQPSPSPSYAAPSPGIGYSPMTPGQVKVNIFCECLELEFGI